MPAWNLSCCRLTFWRLRGDILTSSVPATLGVAKRVLAPRQPVSEPLLGAGGRNAGLDEVQVRIKISGRNINNRTYADDTTIMAESKEERKAFFMKMKKSEKNWLKTQHSKNYDHSIWFRHFVANRWENNGNRDRLYFSGSKITVDGDCSHEINRCLLVGRKA